jgi:cob(I)alamin adenosyltransferase
MSRIYTRQGDQGETRCADGTQQRKNSTLIECNGTLDEANCAIGIARTLNTDVALSTHLKQIQSDLFTAGAEVSANGISTQPLVISQQQVEQLEKLIDHHDEKLPPLTQFILPGGTPLASQLHVARTIVRRAERRLYDIEADWIQDSHLSAYLNRLSDTLFVLARYANQLAGTPDEVWQPPTS